MDNEFVAVSYSALADRSQRANLDPSLNLFHLFDVDQMSVSQD